MDNPDLDKEQIRDLQVGPGDEQIGNGEIIRRSMEIQGDKVRVTRYQGPFEELVWDDLVYIVMRGKLYNPASSHYPIQGSYLSHEVSCDRCHAQIDVSIGIDNKDLCLDCVAFVKSKLV